MRQNDPDIRNFYISKAGSDKANGNQINRAKQSIQEMLSVLGDLDPIPDQNDQAALLGYGRGRYTPDDAFNPIDWTQVYLPVSTIAGDSPTRGGDVAVYKANSFALSEFTGISAYAGQIGLLVDGVLAFGNTSKAIFSFGGDAAVKVTNNAADIFLRCGQVGTTSEGVFIDTKGGGAVICNYDVIDLNADGARAYYVDSDGGNSTVAMKGVLIRKTGSVTSATALYIEQGDNLTFNYDRVQGDVN